MPAYNAAQTLKKTYDVMAQGIVDLIILVDDGSRDETVAIAKTLPKTKAYKHKKIGDMAQTRNPAINYL